MNPPHDDGDGVSDRERAILFHRSARRIVVGLGLRWLRQFLALPELRRGIQFGLMTVELKPGQDAVTLKNGTSWNR